MEGGGVVTVFRELVVVFAFPAFTGLAESFPFDEDGLLDISDCSLEPETVPLSLSLAFFCCSNVAIVNENVTRIVYYRAGYQNKNQLRLLC